MLQDLEIPNDNNTSNNNNSDNYDDSSNGVHISSIDLNDSSTQSSQNSEEESSTSLVVGAETKPVPALSSKPADVVDDFGLMLKHTLDGFLLILSNDGDITYVTGNIADYLGISKVSFSIYNSYFKSLFFYIPLFHLFFRSTFWANKSGNMPINATMLSLKRLLILNVMV